MTRDQFKNLVVGDIIQLNSSGKFKNSFIKPFALADVKEKFKLGKKMIAKVSIKQEDRIVNSNMETLSDIEITDDRNDEMIRCAWTYDAWELYSTLYERHHHNRLKTVIQD